MSRVLGSGLQRRTADEVYHCRSGSSGMSAMLPHHVRLDERPPAVGRFVDLHCHTRTTCCLVATSHLAAICCLATKCCLVAIRRIPVIRCLATTCRLATTWLATVCRTATPCRLVTTRHVATTDCLAPDWLSFLTVERGFLGRQSIISTDVGPREQASQHDPK